MDFQLNEEQGMLENSITRFVQNKYSTLEDIEASRKLARGFDEESWQQLVEMGLLMMPFSEKDGGLGYGAVETGLVMEALGRGLVAAPFLNSVVIIAAVLRHGANDAQKQQYIAPFMEGTWRGAFAHGEAKALHDPFRVETTAKADGDSYVLNGAKAVVAYAEDADGYIVSARSSGGMRDKAGISLFLVPADSAGIKATHFVSADGGRASNLVLDNVRVAKENLIGAEGKGGDIVERTLAEGMVAMLAEAVGIMDALTKLTVDYLKQRTQFGVAIGTFQILQHKAVDMFIATEQATSMAYYAMMMLTSEDADERLAALSAAKVQINKSARFVGQEGVQLHGGIGMTMEYIGAHYFRRLTMIEALFGSNDTHLRNVINYGQLVA